MKQLFGNGLSAMAFSRANFLDFFQKQDTLRKSLEEDTMVNHITYAADIYTVASWRN